MHHLTEQQLQHSGLTTRGSRLCCSLQVGRKQSYGPLWTLSDEKTRAQLSNNFGESYEWVSIRSEMKYQRIPWDDYLSG